MLLKLNPVLQACQLLAKSTQWIVQPLKHPFEPVAEPKVLAAYALLQPEAQTEIPGGSITVEFAVITIHV